MVARRVPLPCGRRETALLPVPGVYRLPDGSRIEFGQFTPLDRRFTETWRAVGRIFPAGIRLVPYARVEVEVVAHGPEEQEIWLRPRSAFVYRWGSRRSRRYFKAAHLAADSLASVLRAPHLAAGAARSADRTTEAG